MGCVWSAPNQTTAQKYATERCVWQQMEIKNILFIAFLRALRKKLSERAIQTENGVKCGKYFFFNNIYLFSYIYLFPIRINL